MSILDELDEAGPDSSGSHKSVLDELTGLDADGEADAAEKETREEARSEIGQAILVAVKGNNAKELYKAIADLIANEG